MKIKSKLIDYIERQDEELIQDAERTIKKIEKVLFRG